MPAHQLIPPGGIDLHAALVAASPAALALSAGSAHALAGASRAARILGWAGMGAALLLCAAFLLPHGLAAASDYPLGRGWVRLGPWQAAGMLLAGLWAVGAWRPRPDGECGSLGWGLRVCVSMLMPIALLPALGLLAVGDGASAASRLGTRWRALCALALLGLSIAVWLARDADAGDALAPRLCAAAALALAAVAARMRWRPVLALGCLCTLLPLPA
jgi:hypothetical protein